VLPMSICCPHKFRFTGNHPPFGLCFAGDRKHWAEAAACSFLASFIQHRIMETTLEAICPTLNVEPGLATVLHQFCLLCSIQLLLWAGMLLTRSYAMRLTHAAPIENPCTCRPRARMLARADRQEHSWLSSPVLAAAKCCRCEGVDG